MAATSNSHLELADANTSGNETFHHENHGFENSELEIEDHKTPLGPASNIVASSPDVDGVMKVQVEPEKIVEIVEERGETVVKETMDVDQNQDGNLYVKECEEDVVVMGLCKYMVADRGKTLTVQKEDDHNSVDVTGELVPTDIDDGEKECVHNKENGSFDEQESSVADDRDGGYATGLHQGHEPSDEKDLQETVAAELRLISKLIDHDDQKRDVISRFNSLEGLKIDHQEVVADELSIENEVNSSVATAPVLVNISPPITETRRIGHYNNHQKILLVGEGDFSFAASLATTFLSASNLTATSLDSRDTVISKYSRAEENLTDLQERGAVVIHNIDVRTMNTDPQLKNKLFDRIVFNFPHAGGIYGSCRETESWYIKCHQEVVTWFFDSARHMLSNGGEIHITHKTAHPFDRWNIVGLAELAGLVLNGEKSFDRWTYPGYVNKKAYGSSWDSTFPVGECCTFIFSKT